jgi:hypothetical protein
VKGNKPGRRTHSSAGPSAASAPASRPRWDMGAAGATGTTPSTCPWSPSVGFPAASAACSRSPSRSRPWRTGTPRNPRGGCLRTASARCGPLMVPSRIAPGVGDMRRKAAVGGRQEVGRLARWAAAVAFVLHLERRHQSRTRSNWWALAVLALSPGRKLGLGDWGVAVASLIE